MERDKVYKAIDSERDYQDKKWGGMKHDKDHDPAAWLLFIEYHLNEAKKNVYEGGNPFDQLRKIAALAVVVGEVYGVPTREIEQPITYGTGMFDPNISYILTTDNPGNVIKFPPTHGTD